MKNGNPKLDPSKGVQAASNEFAPTIINNGDGTNVEANPAPAPKASLKNEDGAAAGFSAAEALDNAGKEWQPPPLEEQEREFVNYVNGDLKEVADKLGYDLKLTKRNVKPGPVMLYDAETEEGKVFGSRAEAPQNYIGGDELNARRAVRAE